jgi:hypothetical protein
MIDRLARPVNNLRRCTMDLPTLVSLMSAGLEQFTVDAGCAAGRAVALHPAAQVAPPTRGQDANGRTNADLKSEQEK